jgi:hypothetical protein
LRPIGQSGIEHRLSLYREKLWLRPKFPKVQNNCSINNTTV